MPNPPLDTSGRKHDGEYGPVDWRGQSLHLLALCNLAVSQPVLDVLSRQVTFLVAHKLGPFALVGLAVGLSWALPVSLIAFERLLRVLSARISCWVHALLMFLLSFLVALLLFKELPPAPSVVVVTGCLVLAALFVVAYLKQTYLRSFLSLLAASALVVPVVFVLNGSVLPLVFPPDLPEARPEDRASTPVVMIVFDALPLSSLMTGEGELVRERYPAFWRLAQDSHWFRNATTVNDETRYALPALLTGNYPSRGRAPSRAHYPNNAFTLLSDRYQICAEEQYSQMSPEGPCLRDQGSSEESWPAKLKVLASDLRVVYLHLILPEELTASLPEVGTRWNRFSKPSLSGRGDDRLYEDGAFQASFGRFVGAMGEDSPHTFHFLHILLPHVPWTFSPSGRLYGRLHEPDEPDGAKDDVWGHDEWLIQQGLQRHLLQLGFADKLLGDAMERLRQVKMYDRSLIVVTADHGASFRAGDSRRGISPTNYHEILPIPLFIKLPDQTQPVLHDENLEIIDVLPTLAGALGIEPDWETDGGNALAEDFVPRQRKVFFDVENGRRLPLGDQIEQKFQSARDVVRLFGTDWESLYRVGPNRELVGRGLDELNLVSSPSDELQATLEQEWLFQDLDPGDPYLPLRIHGTIRPDPSRLRGGGLDLAVAINGRIRAVTRTHSATPSEASRLEFAVMVPETSLRNGRNDVRVFVVADGGESLNHASLVPNESYSWKKAAELIVSSSGKRYRVDPRAVQGGVWRYDFGLQGWAVDLRRAVPAEKIVIFLDGEYVSFSELFFQTPGLADQLARPDLGYSAFRTVLPDELLVEAGHRDLRVFALLGSCASELSFVEPHEPARDARERSSQ